MRHFARVMRLAFGHRIALAGILVTSLLIACLWGANIATLGPLIKVVFEGNNLPGYVTQEIEAAREKIDELELSITQRRQELATASGTVAAALQLKIDNDVAIRDAYKKSIQWLAW